MGYATLSMLRGLTRKISVSSLALVNNSHQLFLDRKKEREQTGFLSAEERKRVNENNRISKRSRQKGKTGEGKRICDHLQRVWGL